MNKFKKVSVATIAGLAIFGTTVFGTTGKVYNTSQGLVLRAEASKTGAPLATIPNDKEFEIVEDLGEWYKVNVDGKEGYLFAEYVEVQNTSSNETPETNEPSGEEPVDSIEVNSTKIETKIYMLPVITSSTIGTIPANTELNVIKILNNWAYVSYENSNGWIRTYNYNVETVETEQPEEPTETEPEEEKPEEKPNTTVETNAPVENTDLSFTRGYINESSVNVRKEPSTSSEVITTLLLNTGVTISAQTDEWYKVTYGDYTGYVYKPLISENPIVTNRGDVDRTPTATTEPETPAIDNKETIVVDTTVAPSLPDVSTGGDAIVTFAKQYLGYRYVLGGTTPSSGFDCSGFVYYVFNSNGYNISRSLYAQASTGTAVTKSELQPGDVVFFNNTSSGSLGHVGIYIGDGMMVHAANSKRGVVTDTINSGYYNTYYYSARRIAN